MQTVKQNFKRAIEYFDFKQKFAKNKEYHNMQVNNLVKAYNTMELTFTKQKVNQIINALLLQSFFFNLYKYENQDIAMNKTAFELNHPQIVIEYYNEWLRTKAMHHVFNSNLSEKELVNKFVEIQQKKYTGDLINEILTNLKQTIKWS